VLIDKLRIVSIHAGIHLNDIIDKMNKLKSEAEKLKQEDPHRKL